jgi:hypothetical protein
MRTEGILRNQENILLLRTGCSSFFTIFKMRLCPGGISEPIKTTEIGQDLSFTS